MRRSLPRPSRPLACLAPLVALVLAAPSARAQEPAGSPEAVFEALEQRLLHADTVRLAFDVTATGAAEIEVRGHLALGPDGRAEIRAEGAFAGQPVDLFLETRGGTYAFGATASPADGPVPAHLREALVLGLTRMGILHNIARLSGNAPPDHADGGVADWVVVDGFRWPDAGAAEAAVAFDITVSGQPAGAAVLALGPDGMPRTRRQTVHFPEGDMEVVERYARPDR
jgi:hypothetical protein